MANLFRTEVLEHKQQAWLGGIQLIRPLSLSLLTAFVVVCAALVVAFLFIGQYTQKARVAGYLVPEGGVIGVRPAVGGTVVRRLVAEGQAVHKGDALFELSLDQQTLAGGTQAAVQKTLAARELSLQGAARQRSQFLVEQQASLGRRIEQMRSEQKQLDSEAELQQRRLALAEENEAQWKALQAGNFVSQAQVQSKTAEVLNLKAELQKLERQRGAYRRDIEALDAERRQLVLRMQSEQGEIERDLAELAQKSVENEARSSLVVRAEQDGVVTTVLAEPGQVVSTTSTLASVVPAHSPLRAYLFAPSSAVGFVQADQSVLLRYQAYPYQKFGHQPGKVLQVSKTPLQASELVGLPLAGAANEPLYRITVALDQQVVPAYGREQPLAAGMQLEADVLLDRRRLIEWIFEPLIGVAGRV